MTTRQDVVTHLLQDKTKTIRSSGQAFAPTNIALCKYWGKRNRELNLPMNDSLSIALNNWGATTEVGYREDQQLTITVNHSAIDATAPYGQHLLSFLALFDINTNTPYHIDINCTVPLAAGCASSACVYASLVGALSDIHVWELTKKELSILARLGSGSACRSFYNGFAHWHAGTAENGLDSFATPLPYVWPELCVGVLLLDSSTKHISSRVAMQQTIDTSPIYSQWPTYCEHTLNKLLAAIKEHNFSAFGEATEQNAMMLHATMQTAWPPINYNIPETIAAQHNIWAARREGLDLYFTQDAGPNLKLLYLEKDHETVSALFPGLFVIRPFLEEKHLSHAY